MASFIQANLNRNREAQDLMFQQAAELGVDLCVISEPARSQDSYRWHSSLNGLAAVYVNDRNTTPVISLIFRNENFVVISFNDLYIVSAYISPNAPIAAYSLFLDDLTDICAQRSRDLIVCGDFNAHAISWGSPSTDSRGHLVEEWAAQLDLRLANTGSCPTCVHPQGSSIIDLTWVSPSLLRRVREWRVRQDIFVPVRSPVCNFFCF